MNPYKYLKLLFLLLLVNQHTNSVIVELEVLEHKKTGRRVYAFGDCHEDVPTDAIAGKTPGRDQKHILLSTINEVHENVHVVAEDADHATDSSKNLDALASMPFQEAYHIIVNHYLEQSKENKARTFIYKGTYTTTSETVQGFLLAYMVPLSSKLGASSFNAEVDRRPLTDNIKEAIAKLGGISAITERLPYPEKPNKKHNILEKLYYLIAPKSTPISLPPALPVLKQKEAKGLVALHYIAKTKIEKKITDEPEYQFIHDFIENNYKQARHHVSTVTLADYNNTEFQLADNFNKRQLTNEGFEYLVDAHFLHETIKNKAKKNVFLLGGAYHTRTACKILKKQGDYEQIALVAENEELASDSINDVIDIGKTLHAIANKRVTAHATKVGQALQFCYQAPAASASQS